jgi:hypothetical protein
MDAKAPSSTAVTLTGTQTLTNKTLTSPALTTPTISTATTNGDILYGTGSGALARLGIGSSAQVLTVASGIPSWATPASGTTFVGCSANGLTSLTNGATTYSLAMTAEAFDYTDPFHDNSTNNTRFTIPTGKGGKYQINFKVGFDNASGTPGYEHTFVRVNGTGTFTVASQTLIVATSSGTNIVQTASGILSLAAGDYIEVLCRTDNGNGTVNATLILTIGYLGA